MDKIKIGLYGLGNISVRVIQGIAYSKNATLYGVCSRNMDKANDFKEKFHAVKAYDVYEEMLMDKDVDLIYICTPNYLHKGHILQALKHSKHVVCEKPMCISSQDLKECFQKAREMDCFLMEAHKCAFTPLNIKIKKMICEGKIGDVVSIEAQYATKLISEISSWHYDKPGAGCMFDIGVYPICLANLMADSQIKRVSRFLDQALIEYENGCVAHIATSWDCTMENTAHIYGTKGTITYKNFWKTNECMLNDEIITVDQDSDFTGEIEHACTCIQSGVLESPIMSYKASFEILKVVESQQ
jgi:predicted dehydrogenase